MRKGSSRGHPRPIPIGAKLKLMWRLSGPHTGFGLALSLMVTETTMARSGLRRDPPEAHAPTCHPANAARTAKALVVCGLTLFAAGCVETTAKRDPEPQMPQRTNMVLREGVSPHGASVAIADIQGVPAPVSEHLLRIFEQDARTREINLADPKAANYLVRGYLSASPAEGGATFALIWDVYDARKRRTQRIDDSVFVKGATGTLETINDAVLTEIAAKSSDDLAAVLSNMPEAIAAASVPGAKAVSVARASEDGTTTVSGTPPAMAASPPQTGKGVAAASR
jgi:hypothetical protein